MTLIFLLGNDNLFYIYKPMALQTFAFLKTVYSVPK